MAKVREQYWLMKSEPSVYSIDDFAKDKVTLWTGIRNYQARNFMMHADATSTAVGPRMSVGDSFLFYHSNAEPTGIVGLGQILKLSVADPEQFNAKSEYYDPKAKRSAPIWYCAECKFIKKYPRVLTLSELRADPKFKNLLVLKKGQRLSIQPVTSEDFLAIEKTLSRDSMSLK